MMLVGCGLLYLAIVKNFEPLLLVPIGFGAILTNIPIAGFSEVGGLLHYVYYAGIDTGIFPSSPWLTLTLSPSLMSALLVISVPNCCSSPTPYSPNTSVI